MMVGLVRRMVLPVVLVAAAALGYAFGPGGVGRALLVLPAVLWVPGRGLVALFGIGSGAGRWRTPLSVLLSLLTLIAGALLANAVGGSVPVTALPLVVSVVFLPAHLVGDPAADRPSVSTGALVRFGAIFTVAALAFGAVLWTVHSALPKQQTAPYLEFALAGPYARVDGTVSVTAGQQLRVPVSVNESSALGTDSGAPESESSALTVRAEINGTPVGQAVPVPGTTAGSHTAPVDGSTVVDVTAPAGCLNRLSIVLERGTTELRSVDLYLRSSSEPACAPRN
jgi:hypothetical protein